MTHPRERRGELGGVRKPDPDKSAWRMWLWKADWAWRRVVPLACLGLALIVLLGLDSKVDKTQLQVEAQREGRRVAREVLCGGLNGVEEAGRLILLGELPSPAPQTPRFSRPERQRRDAYARAYARVISDAVLKQAGVEAQNVIRPNGTIDCDELNRVARDRGDK